MKNFLRFGIVIFWIVVIFTLLYTRSGSSQPKKQTLNILAWSDIFDDASVRAFEKKSGMQVSFSYFDTNEELLVKLHATGGKGHDLIVASDYAIKMLREDGLLMPLDHSKLDFTHRLHPKLLNHDFDPENQYSLPFQWEVYGLSYNSQYFADGIESSWKQVFEKNSHRVGMVNDPIEAINIASFYLHGKKNTLSASKVRATGKLLCEQRNNVEAYADFRVGYLIATKNCPIAVSASSYNYRMIKDYPFIHFTIPKEGSFITIESVAILVHSEKTDAAHNFLNSVYRKKHTQQRTEQFAAFPPTTDNLPPNISPEYQATYYDALSRFDSFSFLRHLTAEATLRDLWIEVKSHK